MKQINIRLKEELHQKIFKASYEESLRQNKRVSMNDIVCASLEYYLEMGLGDADPSKGNKIGIINDEVSVDGNGTNDIISAGSISDAIATSNVNSANDDNDISATCDARTKASCAKPRIKNMSEYIRYVLKNGGSVNPKEVVGMYGVKIASVYATVSRIRKEFL